MSKDTITSDYNNLKKNVSNTKDSAKDFAEGLAQEGAEAFSTGNIKEVASKIIDEITDFLENKKNDISGAKGKCKSHIKENPFLVVIGAFIVGAVIGLLFKK